MRVLFVCLGNICRSPAAEGVLSTLIQQRNLSDKISCDSAGIIGFHAGNKADARMISHASKRGYNIESITRQFNPEFDFDAFDLILGLDHNVIESLLKMTRSESDAKKIKQISEYTIVHKYDVVPDPYYGGENGFELVLDILEDVCEGIIDKHT